MEIYNVSFNSKGDERMSKKFKPFDTPSVLSTLYLHHELLIPQFGNGNGLKFFFSWVHVFFK
jgi:hypothetical protein